MVRVLLARAADDCCLTRTRPARSNSDGSMWPAEHDGANERVPVDTFLAAWDTGNETMIVTDAA
jgi:hypothetical protein